MQTLIPRLVPLALVPLALALPSRAQGADACTAPTPISGEGNFNFNTSSATTGSQGQSQSACNFFGETGIDRDVWFVWTSPEDGFATLSLCGGASFDTKVAVYAGVGCPAGSALDCDDDSCSVQSQIGFAVTLGGLYTIQLGSYPGQPGGSGDFSITVDTAPPCGGTGPDVIVGELMDILNTTAQGGIDAIALGTYSCNIGSQELQWVASNNNHPVIRQNVYRYTEVDNAGRFEQIGLSWLKHGFTALQDELCCPTCVDSGTGSRLGVGCADPYTASLNGSQGGLGPNWQVNAHTGVFVYPPAGGTGGGGNTYRRCEMLLSDINVPGSLFYGEGQYVAKDDAAAGNQNNNASWRPLTVTGSPANYTFSLAGVTNREEPAIRAWAQVDSEVNLQDLQVAGDGLIVLGSRATDLGSNRWRYEYAVYNMNADRNVGTFSVPVPSDVTVTSVEFHDVTYRNGDGISNASVSGADWVASYDGSAITWATETQIQNANANAIRWGTMYNFRFDADTPPEDGSITLGLWKPGTPNTIAGTGDVPSSAGDGIAGFCFPDVLGVRSCPCANPRTAPDVGCDSYVDASTTSGTGGAKLTASGTQNASVFNTLVFHVTQAHNPAGNTNLHVFWMATSTLPAGVKSGFGVRCVTAVARIYQGTGTGFGGLGSTNAIDFPNGTQTTDAWTASQMPGAGTTLYYYDSFRDQQGPTNCNTANDRFNVSHALSVTWAP